MVKKVTVDAASKLLDTLRNSKSSDVYTLDISMCEAKCVIYDTHIDTGKKRISSSGGAFGYESTFKLTATSEELTPFASAWASMSNQQQLKFAIQQGWIKSNEDFIREQNEQRAKWTFPHTDVVAVTRVIKLQSSLDKVHVHGLTLPAA